MAFVWKHPNSQYWMARFYDRNGRRRNRSTRTTNRKKAEKLADVFEEAANRKRTALQVRRVIASLHAEITGENLPVQTVRQFFDSWLASKRPETSPATTSFYEQSLGKFLTSLGERADNDIAEIAREHVLAFRNRAAETLATKTVNHLVKCLRMVFKAAKRDGAIADNPAEFVDTIRARAADRRARRPFTLHELRAIVGVADEEWRSMILFGLYSGQRLSDIAAFRWENIDLQANELRLVTRKTGRRILMPLAGPLKAHVESLPVNEDPEAPLHPRAFATVIRQGKTGGLSNQFAALLAQAGLRQKQAHRKTHGKGGGIGSSGSGLSFHCLRHTAVSLLKEAGIPAATVMELVGHDSAQMSEHYTHVGRESMIKAAESFPEL
jgi:integrase